MVPPSPPIRLVVSCLAAAALAAGCTPAPDAPGADAPWLAEITADAGLDFVHRSGARGEYAMPEIMGGGVALLDADGDGDLDLLCIGTNAGAEDGSDGGGAGTRFYRQVGAARFADATDESGLAQRGYGMGAAVGDVDNDGDEDVYVTCLGANALFVNDGGGRFTEEAAARGAQGGGWSTSAAFLDADRDGLLELFVARYVEHDPDERCHDNAGRRDYCGPKAFPPVGDLYFHNGAAGGGGRFEDRSGPAGIAAVRAAGLGVVCADLDDDGWQDVYVANDAYANHLWINRRDGTFRDEALTRGAALNLSGQPQAGMGVVVADLDADARLDLFVTHLRDEANCFYANRGPTGFSDRSGESRLGPPSMPFTGFGVAALDLDRDGDLDLAIANGGVLHGPVHEGVELAPPWDTYAEPNLLQVNEGAGRFTDGRGHGGAFTARIEVSRGLAAGDVDGDGDPDLLLGQVEGPARLFRNDAGAGRRWIAVRCVHPGWKRDALGARVELVAGGARRVQVLSSSWSYLSSSPPVAFFGLGELDAVEHVEVLWPDGRRERFPGLAVDRLHVLEHGAGVE